MSYISYDPPYEDDDFPTRAEVENNRAMNSELSGTDVDAAIQRDLAQRTGQNERRTNTIRLTD